MRGGRAYSSYMYIVKALTFTKLMPRTVLMLACLGHPGTVLGVPGQYVAILDISYKIVYMS